MNDGKNSRDPVGGEAREEGGENDCPYPRSPRTVGRFERDVKSNGSAGNTYTPTRRYVKTRPCVRAKSFLYKFRRVHRATATGHGYAGFGATVRT